MPQIHLPQDHTDADLILAGQIAASVGSGELFIAWTHTGGPGALPAVPAELREPVTHPVAELLAILLDSAAEAWRALTHPAVEPRRGDSAPGAAPA